MTGDSSLVAVKAIEAIGDIATQAVLDSCEFCVQRLTLLLCSGVDTVVSTALEALSSKCVYVRLAPTQIDIDYSITEMIYVSIILLCEYTSKLKSHKNNPKIHIVAFNRMLR